MADIDSAAPGRSTWKGFLKLSLVTCAVRLVPATSETAKVHLHQIAKASGNRVRQRLIDAGTGEPVDRADIVRGYEAERDSYVIVTDDEIEAIKLESSHTIDIERFIDAGDLDPAFLDQLYYLQPDGPVAGEAYGVIHEAMNRSGKVGIGRVVMSQRERAAVVRPRGRGLAMTLLRGAQEVRSPEIYFADAPESLPAGDGPELLDLAARVIEMKSAPWNPADYVDRYQAALLEVVNARVADRPPAVPAAPASPRNVVNLFEALRKSVEEEARLAPPKIAPAKPPKGDVVPIGKGKKRKAG